MNKIIFPLTPGMQGAAVADMQATLQLCLDRGIFRGLIIETPLSAGFYTDRAGQSYGDSTNRFVGIFQSANHIQVSNSVDEATANVLNALLKEWGMLDEPAQPAYTFPVNIDATKLYYKSLIVQGAASVFFDTQVVQTLQLVPGDYSIQFASGYYADFKFTVASDGLIFYPPAYDSFLSGRGTRLLTINGFQVTLDASQLSGAILLNVFGPDKDAWISQATTIRLLPGSFYTVLQGGGETAEFSFKLGLDGNWLYANEFESSHQGFLSGIYTPSLSFIGFPLQVDATAVTADIGLNVWPICTNLAYSTTKIITVNLLPAKIFYLMSTDGSFKQDLVFSLDDKGEITVDPSLFQIAIKLILISNPNQLKTEDRQGVLPFFSVLSQLVR